jgi:transcriptional regulator with XRE-family HTH domain
MENQSSIATQIKEARQERGLSQVELADKYRLHIRTIQRIENEEVTPRLYTLRIIGEALDVDLIKNNVDTEKEDLKRLRKLFNQRKQIRIVTFIVAILLLFFALLLIFSGIPKMQWAPFIYILFFIDLIVIGFTWRCPGCNSLLGDVFNTRYCSRCGLKF